MTREEKRIEIAQACGWKRRPDLRDSCVLGPAWQMPDGSETNMQPPDYFNCLNAMHEAELILIARTRESGGKDMVWAHYVKRLNKISDRWRGKSIHAEPQLRAEAFGLTLKLWESSGNYDLSSSRW